MPSSPNGRLIILNGGYYAGKTSLGRALQDLFDEPHVLLGIDTFWQALPPRQLDLDRVEPKYYSWTTENRSGLMYFQILPGPILDRAMYARQRAITAFLDSGLNVIADDVVWKPAWLIDALEVFRPYATYLIGVHVSDAEGARRENLQDNRCHIGRNRGSAYCANREMVYDLEVDTTSESQYEVARTLKKYFDAGLRPTAFERLRSRYFSQ